MALFATYNGDVSNDIVGLVLGPKDLYGLRGSLCEAVNAEYDAEKHETRVEFVEIAADDPREARYDDDFGQLRIVSET